VATSQITRLTSVPPLLSPLPDRVTLVASLSREEGHGLPKIREFWWDLSLGRDRGSRCRIYPACGAKPHQGEFAVGVEFADAKIVDNRYRWGSCTVNNNLTFNWRLIKAPMSVIDYVVVHELAHLIEANHTPASGIS
jgi:hypothetical protein